MGVEAVQSSAATAATVEVAAGGPARVWLDAIIARRRTAAEDVVVLDLVPAGGATFPRYEAGAHVDVEVAPGLIRQYSLCGDEEGRYRIAVLRESASRGGSAGIHTGFAEGRRIRIGRPTNNFPLVPGAAPAVLAAGGIGVTPLIAMARSLAAADRPFELHYCVRSERRAAFLDELRTSAFADRVRLHFDNGPVEQRFVPADVVAAHQPDAHLYVCGPDGFMDCVIAAAIDAGWPAERIHLERFGAEVDTAGEQFVVEARISGCTVTVGPDQTIAQALEAAGVEIPLSCEEGVCGTCLTRVLDGVPDHRDLYQTDEEKAANLWIACCSSRARSPRLVLDV
jgi:vanillate monooxygenase ferredoxin subunit